MPNIRLDIDVGVLRKRLGLSEEQLPDDASDDQIAAAFASQTEKPEEREDHRVEEVEEPEAEPTRASRPAVPSGHVIVDEANWARMEEALKASQRIERKVHETERDRDVEDAITAGKFPPSRAEHYKLLYDKDPEGTKQLFADLAKDLVPVEARGVGKADDFDPDHAYPGEWLPEVQARRDAAESGRPLRAVMQAGD